VELTGPVYLDTNAIIWIVELSAGMSEGQVSVLRAIESGEIDAFTSELTLAECLVKPIADKNARLVEEFLALLSGIEAIEVVPVSRPVLIEASRHRAETNVKLADAIHLATARLNECATLISNDRRLLSAWAGGAKKWSDL